jgi:glycosyltransferase involved in cell wall biosynthesis
VARPTKIAIVTACPSDPAAPRGGGESVSVHLLRALAAYDDLDLHVVTEDALRTDHIEYTWEGATVHRLPRRGRKMLTNALGPGRRQMHGFLKTLAPALVHSHDTYGLMVKGFPGPRLHTIHGFIYGDTLVSNERFAWIRSQVWRRVETAGWAEQPNVVSISPYVRQHLEPYATGTIHDIENPISREFFSIARAEAPFTVFSSALICRRKNIMRLVEALARVVAEGIDAKLRLAGAVVEEDYARGVRDRIQALGLERRVEWLGGLTSAGVRQELARASVFVLASLEENAPLGIEEAMAAGVPVVTSNRCGMPYMVSHGETGYLIDPEDAGDIARRLVELLRDDGLRARMGTRAVEIATARFHPEGVARSTRELYLQVVDGNVERRT